MAKGIKEIFKDVKTLLKLIELILCIVTIIFVDLQHLFFNRASYEVLVLGSGGFVLICAVLFVVNVVKEQTAEMLDHIFMLVGAILNIVGGILALVRNVRDRTGEGIFIASLQSEGQNFEILIVVFAISSGAVMLFDFIRSFL